MKLCGSLNILWHCLSLGLEWKLAFSSPVATAEFSKFAGILSAAHIEVALVVKNWPANADVRDVGLILGSGRSPGVRNGNPLQYSCLENYMDKEPCGLQSMGLQRAGQNWVTKYACTSTKVISVSMVIFHPLPPSSQSVRTLYRISVLGRVLCLVLDNYFHIRCFIDKYNAAQCLN